MSMKIMQGDQYYVPIELCFDKEKVTPENVDDVRIQIGDILQSYSEGQLTYSPESQVWLFHLTQNQTRSILDTEVPFQFAVKRGDEIYHSSVSKIPFDRSIIKEDWS